MAKSAGDACQQEGFPPCICVMRADLVAPMIFFLYPCLFYYPPRGFCGGEVHEIDTGDDEDEKWRMIGRNRRDIFLSCRPGGPAILIDAMQIAVRNSAGRRGCRVRLADLFLYHARHLFVKGADVRVSYRG